MSMTDPIADLLTRIRNAYQAAHESVIIPHSSIKLEIVKILNQEGYISGLKVAEKTPVSEISVLLKYDAHRTPAIQVLRRVSKPGRRIYVNRSGIPSVLGGLGVNILSTSRGILTGKQARKEGVGGEILCEVY